MATNRPTRHHFVSSFLLTAFATPQRKDGRLYCFDRSRRKDWESSPFESAKIHEYNTVDPDLNNDDLVWETAQANIEDHVAPILATIRDNSLIPEGEGKSWLLTYMAFLFVNVPRARRRVEGAYLQQLEQSILAYTRTKASRRRWRQKQRKFAEEARNSMPEEVAAESTKLAELSPEEYLAGLKSGDFTITTDNYWKIGLANEAVPKIVNALSRRTWTSFRFREETPKLIIGDHPVTPISMRGDGLHPAGLSRSDSLVYMPLDPRTALLGWPKKPAELLHHDRELAARFNTTQLGWSLDQCYGSESDFEVYRTEGEPNTWEAMLAADSFIESVTDEGDFTDHFSIRE